MSSFNRINEKGFALITVMMIGTVSMMLIAIGAYMVSTGKESTGIQRRYQSEVEIATGTADVVMSQLMNGSLTCTPAQALCVPDPACTPAAQIYISPAVCNALNKPNCNNLSGCYLSFGPDPVNPTNFLVSMQFTSVGDGGENAIIDVVYRFQ